MRKPFLSANRPIVTVDRLNVSFRIQWNQTLTPFLFLILNSTPSNPTPKRVSNAQAQASANLLTFQEPVPSSELVDNLL